MRTGLTKQEKTTDIWFDEKDPLIHIRTHNTDLKRRLAAYAGQYPDECRQTDADPETGCMEFVIRKGRFSFRLTAPYSEERRRAASKAAKAHTDSGKFTDTLFGSFQFLFLGGVPAFAAVLVLLDQQLHKTGFMLCRIARHFP